MTTIAHTSRDDARRTTRRRAILTGTLILAFAIALAVGLSLGEPAAEVGVGPPTPPPELNDMGMPVIPTPGSTHGTSRAGGVEVAGASWDMGEVPLNVAVRPSWTLVNTGTSTVTLGDPHPEVIEGCCPGPLAIGTDSLAPGESTTVTFELSMHPGMDGWHDLRVHVPVSGDDTTEQLTLSVAGDFRS